MKTENKSELHYNYDLQVWVRNGVIFDCGHQESMRADGFSCCNAHELAGQIEKGS